ncbi:trypsin-like peptidase domain-containing protein [soil metagenome]
MIAASPSMTQLTMLIDAELHELYGIVRQSVVLLYRQHGNGAGTIWREDGLIVTNNHVVSGDGKMNVVLADGRTYLGIVAQRHPTRDLAIIKIAETGLPAASIADSSRVRTGEIAAAIGHPLGYRDAITVGIVSASGHSDTAEGPQREDVIQTDALFAPGNSGGPLVNHRGEVIGISTRVSGQLGLAVPSNAVETFVGHFSVETESAYIGITGQFTPIRHTSHRHGFLITSVADQSPAEQAGIIVGDVIVEIDGRIVTDQETVPATMLRLNPPARLALTILRGGNPTQIIVIPEFADDRKDHDIH